MGDKWDNAIYRKVDNQRGCESWIRNIMFKVMKARTRRFKGNLTKQYEQKGNMFCMAEEKGQ